MTSYLPKETYAQMAMAVGASMRGTKTLVITIGKEEAEGSEVAERVKAKLNANLNHNLNGGPWDLNSLPGVMRTPVEGSISASQAASSTADATLETQGRDCSHG